MSGIKTDRAYEDALGKIEKELSAFKAKLVAGMSDPEHFISLAEIEKEWALLNKSTSKAYSDMISSYLSDLDERAIIKAKKGNTGERG